MVYTDFFSGFNSVTDMIIMIIYIYIVRTNIDGIGCIAFFLLPLLFVVRQICVHSVECIQCF